MYRSEINKYIEKIASSRLLTRTIHFFMEYVNRRYVKWPILKKQNEKLEMWATKRNSSGALRTSV